MGQTIQTCEAVLRHRKTDQNSPVRRNKSWSPLIWLPLFLFPIACQTQQISSSPTVSTTNARQTTIDAGHFLAARQATFLNDVKASAGFFLAALEQDERNPELLQHSFVTQYRDGNIDLAAALAGQLEGTNIKAPYAVEPAIAQSIKAADWDAVIVLSDQLAEDVTATPFAGVIKSWVFAATGRGDAGLAHLAETSLLLSYDNNAMPPYLQIQVALMAEYLGHQQEAVVTATQLAKSSALPAKVALQTAGILMRGDQHARAHSLLESLPYSFERSQISAAQLLPPDDIEAFIANAIIDTTLAYRDPQFIIMVPARLQLALYLDSQNDAARFFLGQSWFELGQFNRAKTALLAINDTSLWALPRMLLQNDIDIRTDNLEAAIARFDAHVMHRPNNPYLHKELGDLYRRHEHYEQARDHYLQAKDSGFATANLYRNLAIAHERLDEDAQAEAGFKAALQRNPNDPFTLNYLGYWWAESGRHLDKAIQLIEQAVRLKPDSGFFVDSLGWVHYQLGNYQLAVEFLEKATTLEPEDALIISHLGDAYWQTQRHAEAQFKWRYAAQLADDEHLQAELQTKLASGLARTGQ